MSPLCVRPDDMSDLQPKWLRRCRAWIKNFTATGKGTPGQGASWICRTCTTAFWHARHSSSIGYRNMRRMLGSRQQSSSGGLSGFTCKGDPPKSPCNSLKVQPCMEALNVQDRTLPVASRKQFKGLLSRIIAMGKSGARNDLQLIKTSGITKCTHRTLYVGLHALLNGMILMLFTLELS